MGFQKSRPKRRRQFIIEICIEDHLRKNSHYMLVADNESVGSIRGRYRNDMSLTKETPVPMMLGEDYVPDEQTVRGMGLINGSCMEIFEDEHPPQGYFWTDYDD